MKSTDCGTTMNKKGDGVRGLEHTESARKILSGVERAVLNVYMRADEYDRIQLRWSNRDLDLPGLMKAHQERETFAAFWRHLRLREWHQAELIASNPDNAGMFG